MSNKKMIVIAGDCGVYVGYAEGGTDAVTEAGTVTLHGARHLRRYYVKGKQGDGSAGDLAVVGMDDESPSVSMPVEGETKLLGVRRAFLVSEAAAPTFGLTPEA